MPDPTARDELIDALCEEGAYSAHAAIYMADAYRAQIRAEVIAELQAGPWGPTICLDTIDQITDRIAAKGATQ